MLILCYGITKSGSTLAFELIKGMLESVGHRQDRLPDGPIQAAQPVNFVEPLDLSVLDQLLTAVGERWIAVKTHYPLSDDLFLQLEKQQRDGTVRVSASYRDPRDVCLSLLDAGVKARAVGTKEFSEFTDLAVAKRIVTRKLNAFRRWGALRGALRLEYETVAFSPDQAMDSIEQWLGIACNRERAKRHAFAEAFTQKNKGKRSRAIEELSADDYAELTQAFSEFLEYGNDQRWYAELGQRIRRRGEAHRGPGRSLEERAARRSKRPARAADA